MSKKSLIIPAILLILMAIYAYPLWTGEVIQSGKKILPSSNYRLPSYYLKAAEWLESKPAEYRIFPLPYPELGYIATDWEHGGYGSVDPLISLLKPSFVWGPFGGGIATEFAELMSADYPSKEIWKLLRMLNVKHVLVRNDLKPPIKNIGETLEKQRPIQLEKSFGLLDLYQLPDEIILPRIYATHKSVLMYGKRSQLIDLAELSYLDQSPAIFLSDDVDFDELNMLEKFQSIVLTENIDNFVLNLFFSDFQFQMPEGGAVKVAVAPNTIHELYWRGPAKETRSMLVRIDEHTLQMTTEPYGSFSRIGEVKIGQENIATLTTDSDTDESKFYLVPKERLRGHRQAVVKKLKSSDLDLAYLHSRPLKTMQILKDGVYTIKAKLRPNAGEELHDEGLNLSFVGKDSSPSLKLVAENTEFEHHATPGGLVVNALFDLESGETEYVLISPTLAKKVDLLKYPLFEVGYQLVDSQVQVIRLSAGIDTTGDGKEDIEVEMLDQPKTKPVTRNNSFRVNLHKLALKRAPALKKYDLVRLDIYQHKRSEITKAKKRPGVYSFLIEYIKLFRVESKSMFATKVTSKSREYALNLNLSDSVRKKLVTKTNSPQGSEWSIALNPQLPLSTYPIVEMKMRAGRFEIMLELDGPRVSLSQSNLRRGKNGVLHFNALDLVAKAFPDRKDFMLVRLLVREDKTGGVASLPVANISIYRNTTRTKRIPANAVRINNMGIFKIDDKKFSINSDAFDTWFEWKNVRLSQGTHSLRELANDHVMLKSIYIRPRQQKIAAGSVGPVVEFMKVDPTEYLLKIAPRRPFWLVFGESYHNGWTASQNTQNGAVEIGEHLQVNGFANAWYMQLPPESGAAVKLKFTPQDTYEIGFFISVSAMCLSLIFLLLAYVRHRDSI